MSSIEDVIEITGRTRRSLLMGTAALFMYGGWAIYANWEHGLAVYSVAAVIQGTLSFLSTALVTFTMEVMFGWLHPGWRSFAMTAVLPPTLFITLMIVGHAITNTPRIMWTIAPSVVVGYTYCFMYTTGLYRRRDG